jgi:hypothetical protein
MTLFSSPERLLRLPRLRASRGVMLVLVACFGCNALFSIEEPTHQAAAALTCTLNSDCPTGKGQVCVFSRCSPPCAADVDCTEANTRCLHTDVGTACVAKTQSACKASTGADASTSDASAADASNLCPSGTQCVNDGCYGVCSNATPCADGHACQAGVCTGSAPNAGQGGAGPGGLETGGSGGSTGGSNPLGGGGLGPLGNGGSAAVSDNGGGGGSLTGGGSSGTAGSGGSLTIGGSSGAGGSSGSAHGGSAGSGGSGGAAPTCLPACPGGQTCGAGAKCACPQAKPNLCNATCTDEQADALNCGACSHSCLGSDCVGGACQPMILASGRTAPWGIAVNASGVYWLEQAAVMAVPLDGGTAVPLASSDYVLAPGGIAASASTVYWTNSSGGSVFSFANNAVMQVLPLGGAVPKEFAKANSSISYPWGITVSAGVVYWVDTEYERVYQAAEGAGSETPAGVGSNNGIDHGNVAVDGANLYSSSLGNVLDKTVIASGVVTPFDSLDPNALSVNQIVGQQGFVYWSSGTATVPQTTTPANSVISKISNAGGTSSTFASGLSVTPALAADASGIYWDNGDLRRTPVAGGASVVVAAKQNAGFIALDSQFVYWTDATSGTVKKVAK